MFAAAQVTPIPFETGDVVCEFQESHFLVDNPQAPPVLGDWRPPEISCFNFPTSGVTNRTPNDARIDETLGLRSAGSTSKLAILCGPVLAPFGAPAPGTNLFAFNAKTGA